MRTKNKKIFNRVSKGWNFVFHIILIIYALLVIIPVSLVVIVSFSTTESIDTLGYTFTPLGWTLQGYEYVFKTGQQVWDSYFITIVIAVLGTILTLLVNSLYAYVLCQNKFKLRMAFFWFMYITTLFGGGLVSSYILNTRVYHLNNTLWIHIFPGLVSGGSIIILRTFIKTTIPESLFEAAKMDGASHIKMYCNIVLPLFKAGAAVIGLTSFIGRWNDWFVGMLYIQNPKLVPIQTLLTKIQKNVDFIKNNAELQSTPDGLETIKNMPADNLRMAILVLVLLPIMCAYPFFQRYFITGLTMGGVKE